MAVHATVSSLVRSLGPERGVALTVFDSAALPAKVKVHRASGLHLEALGVMSALLGVLGAFGTPRPEFSGNRRLDAGSSITVLVPESLEAAITEVCATGRILLPEASTALTAIARSVTKHVQVGVSVSFRVGSLPLSPEASAAFEAVVAEELAGVEASAALTASWSLPAGDAAWVAEHGATVVYTDGSFAPESGFGSWAWYVDGSRSSSGTVAGSGSSLMERRAALEALRALDGPVLLVTDLELLVPSVSARVLSRAEARLVKSLRRLVESRQVRILTVKGHAHCPGNLAVDRLAGETLTATWSRLSADAVLSARLTALYRERRANLKEARRLANDRRMRHGELYGSQVSERSRARAAARQAAKDAAPAAFVAA